jgi:hypothetical protein
MFRATETDVQRIDILIALGKGRFEGLRVIHGWMMEKSWA